jgi:hypothetical protein
MVIFRGGGGDKGYFMPWNKNRKHQKLIYSTELGLNKIKNPYFCGNLFFYFYYNLFLIYFD